VASLFICVSKSIRERALQIGFPESKLLVHYVGIDRTMFASDERLREPIVLFVGRFVEKKGCKHLVRAMQKVQQVMPAARLVLIGFGPLQPSLEALTSHLGVCATFEGRCSSEEVKRWLERARVLCVPSVSAPNGDSEGLPTVIMEANAMRVPVVGFEHAGIPEIVKHGETGLLYPEGDVDGLAAGLLRFLTDDGLWRAAGHAAARRVAEQFDLHSQGAKLESLYDELIAKDTCAKLAAQNT
jgi:glycosyltransferase involved in cell wall biosynthesis